MAKDKKSKTQARIISDLNGIKTWSRKNFVNFAKQLVDRRKLTRRRNSKKSPNFLFSSVFHVKFISFPKIKNQTKTRDS